MVVECTGAWDKAAAKVLWEIARAVAAREGADGQALHGEFLQELGVTARRFRARAILRRRAELGLCAETAAATAGLFASAERGCYECLGFSPAFGGQEVHRNGGNCRMRRWQGGFFAADDRGASGVGACFEERDRERRGRGSHSSGSLGGGNRFCWLGLRKHSSSAVWGQAQH